MMGVMMLPGVHHLALLVLVHRVELESELSSIVHIPHHHTSSHYIIYHIIGGIIQHIINNIYLIIYRIIYHIINGTCAKTEGMPS